MFNPRAVLKGLARISTVDADLVDESELWRATAFFPVRQQALEPNSVMFILGARETGKTHLFRIAHTPGAMPLLGYRELTDTIWITGYFRFPETLKYMDFPLRFPDQSHLLDMYDVDLKCFWLGLLLGAILLQEDKIGEDFLRPVKNQVKGYAVLQRLRQPYLWYHYVVRERDQIIAALTHLDAQLRHNDKYLIVAYDSLDSLRIRTRGIPKLSSIVMSLFLSWIWDWRWVNIRPKFFVRPETYFAELGRPRYDRCYEIIWDEPHLYGTLFKLLANQGQECREFLEHCGFFLAHDPLLGWYISGECEDAVETALLYLLGAYVYDGKKAVLHDALLREMGQKIIDDLSDASGNISPKAVVDLFAKAARRHLRQDPNSNVLYLAPHLRASMRSVGQEWGRKIKWDYPWIECAREALRGLKFPASTRQVIKALEKALANCYELNKPESARDAIYLLHNMGIIRVGANGAPDGMVFLDGIGKYALGLSHPGRGEQSQKTPDSNPPQL